MSDTRSADPGDEASDRPPGPTSDDTLAALQGAARQLISAARGLLDAAEAAVEDPRLVRDAVDVLGGLARDAARMATEAGRSGHGTSDGRQPGRPDDDGDGPVQHIPVG